MTLFILKCVIGIIIAAVVTLRWRDARQSKIASRFMAIRAGDATPRRGRTYFICEALVGEYGGSVDLIGRAIRADVCADYVGGQGQF